jgi:hypothetical protein
MENLWQNTSKAEISFSMVQHELMAIRWGTGVEMVNIGRTSRKVSDMVRYNILSKYKVSIDAL